MDKKRRNKESVESTQVINKNKCVLNTISKLVNQQKHCSVHTKKISFLPEIGNGHFEYNYFDGLFIGMFDVMLKNDFKVCGKQNTEVIELSYLIDGEQIIKIDEISNNLIYESQESYLVYISKVSGSILYHKNKHFKEIKIRMYSDFIKKHKLNSEYGIYEKYAIEKVDRNFAKPLCSKTQAILAELLTDTRKGLLKRLFLESKVLELLYLYLENKKSYKSEASTTDNLIKKLYEVQFIINSDLTTQYSLHELAREVGLNDFILKKEFKRVFHKTIFEYALNTRMIKAKKLLKHSKKPIYEISELIGYKNSTHFTAAFKKVEGTTPKKYRQNDSESLK
ncbi:helix-turn-helix domain-containing protein [Aquimarina muelleri]|uniref:AraC family transcriptional regulator n=1 Tax=Aquimarina muelleri TaxID=279356 RepID=A0A918N422_9FLAO|nr:AraC family transcriptional regulator [Aquimarina muelleri]MCX2762546.1 AraC family transcriptional regulator [Aquimarina muelleri]GGX24299.1 AraC family transcriptional regulator [Aquimarina muelleri]